MRHLETYKIFEAKKAIGLNTKQVAFLNKYIMSKPGRSEWLVDYSTDPPTVNVFSSLNTNKYRALEKDKIKSLQGIHFGKIQNDVILNDIEISTYKGFPKEIGGKFELAYNLDLKVPFKEFPNVKVLGNFRLEMPSLESLETCPEEVGSLTVHHTRILDMVGCPKRYTNPTGVLNGGIIFLRGNSRLVSLEGIPKEVNSDQIIWGYSSNSSSDLPTEVLIEGFKDFQKTGTWIPYYLMIKQKYEWCMHDDGMRDYLASKINPETIQEFINQNPAKAAAGLKGIWTEMKRGPKFSGVKFPEEYAGDADLAADLSDVGL